MSELLAANQIANEEEVVSYQNEAKQKLDIDRSAEGREKTGVKLEGVTAINPVNGEEVPVFIADYVLPQYGTGAIMAVPAHDARDYEFAKKYNIPMREVIAQVYGAKKPDAFERNRVGVVIEHEGRFLCEEIDVVGTKFNSTYVLLGGGIEKGEDSLSALKRELQEEIGTVDIRDIKLLGTYRMSWFSKNRNENRSQLQTIYSVQVDISKIIENKQEAKLTWLSGEDLLKAVKDDSPDQYSAVQKYISHKDVSFTADGGELINSGEFNGLTSEEARHAIIEKVGGKIVTKSKLRDWVFARQRYWGEPIPIVYDKEGRMYPVAETEFPIILPQVEKYEPTDNGESPLSQVPSWVYVKGKINESGHFVSDKSGEEFRRETDTMPQWAGSSWYFMRYIDPRNENAIGDKELLAKWLPVDWYNGGMEHTTLHLLYSRFWYKFLFDIGLVPTSEPYYKRTSQGMILASDGSKMSKSIGNTVNPDELVEKFGADVVRVYEMFIGPFDQAVAWDDKAIVGVKRFLDKVEVLSTKVSSEKKNLTSLTHKTIKAVSEGIENMAFNTCVSSLMIWQNEYEKSGIDSANFTAFLKLLSPFAPYLTEELFEKLGNSESIHKASWPVFDESKLIELTVTISVQVNGKLRGTIIASRDAGEEMVFEEVKKTDYFARNVGDASIKKVIFVPNKIINIII